MKLLKDALNDTHEIFIDRRLTTHGDIFAVRKDYVPIVIEKEGFNIIKRPGLPDKMQTK